MPAVHGADVRSPGREVAEAPAGVHAGLPDEGTPALPPPDRAGSLLHFTGLRSRFLPREHDILVALPPEYEAHPERRHPVVYLHDGQNVFDDYPMAPFGVQWGVDTTVRALIHAGALPPLILVAIGNAGRERIDEYTPTRDAAHDAGGMADRYGQMLAYEIKPFVDHTFRTRPEAEHTGMLGSSLGGLLTLHLGLLHPALFGVLGLMSPSVWWDDRWIVRQLVTSAGGRPDLRIWLDVGTGETRMLKGVRLLRRTLERRGWIPGEDLAYEEVPDARHTEHAWAERVGRALRFLFPV